MEKQRYILLSLFLLVLGLSVPAAAYVDPGTSAALFQVAYAAMYTILAGLAVFFRPIKRFFLSIKARLTGKRNDTDANSDS